MEHLTDVVPAIAMGIGLAACAGIRAWLPLLLTGGLVRAGLLGVGEDFSFLGSNRALAVFAIAALIEIAGDKLPAVDHALDLVSSLLRPAAGALLAASVIARVSDPLTAAVLGLLVGAPSALVPHAAKATLRGASTLLTAGVANPLLSLIEDLMSVCLFALAVLVPLLVAGLVLLLAFFTVRRLRRRAELVAAR